MIVSLFGNIFTFLLLAVLIFNMSQRKHLEHGKIKRFATLKIAGVLFIAYAGFWAVERMTLPAVTVVPVLAIAVVVAYFFRRDLFPFRARCASCGSRLSLDRILYYDSNTCQACDTGREQGEESELPSTIHHADPNRDIPDPKITPEEPVPRKATEIDWDGHRFDEEAVLCFIVTDGKALLIHKKTGLGAGKVNAPGGRLEPGETAADAAVRETLEETCVTPIDVEERAELSFLFTNGFSLHVKAFIARGMSGVPQATHEADPFFCPVDDIPYDKMWADDREWLPHVLAGKYVRGWFIFEGDTMIDKKLEIR